MSEFVRGTYDQTPDNSGQFHIGDHDTSSEPGRADSIERARFALKMVITDQESQAQPTQSNDTLVLPSQNNERLEALDLSIGRTVMRGKNLVYLREIASLGKI
jgi:hypothetical protein